MIENQSKTDVKSGPSRFSVCVSRTPRGKAAPGKKVPNKYASYWKDATGLAAAIGNRISAKTGRPIGIIFMQNKKDSLLKNWISPDFLKETPSLMEDYKTVGSVYRDNPYYLANFKRYIAEWKTLWADDVPAMIKTKAVPDGSSWGNIPSPKPQVGDSKATWTYNVFVNSFGPLAHSGVIFLTGESLVAADQGANFGPEMSVLANCFKAKFGATDVPFIYTVPAKSLAAKITQPQAIKGNSKAVELNDWTDVSAVIEAVAK
jgi:hypothetical protein